MRGSVPCTASALPVPQESLVVLSLQTIDLGKGSLDNGAFSNWQAGIKSKIRLGCQNRRDAIMALLSPEINLKDI